MIKKKYDLATIYADLDNMIIRAQEELEDVIVQYGLAMDAYAQAEADYRKEKAETIRTLKQSGHSVTLILDMAQGDCSALKKNMLLSESNVKRLRALVSALEHRLNGIKFIGNRAGKLAGDK